MVAGAVGREGALATLPPRGTVTVADKLARCVRPGLTEEYSVSVDGVRQDFVVPERPAGDGAAAGGTGRWRRAGRGGGQRRAAGAGQLRAQAGLQPAAGGGCRGQRELAARLEVVSEPRAWPWWWRMPARCIRCGLTRPSATRTGSAWAAFPARMARCTRRWWMARAISTSAATSPSWAMVVANRIAKWNGSTWSALGSGMNGAGHWRWRCRAATCMREAISRRRAAARPTTLPNGTGARGRPWARG